MLITVFNRIKQLSIDRCDHGLGLWTSMSLNSIGLGLGLGLEVIGLCLGPRLVSHLDLISDYMVLITSLENKSGSTNIRIP